MSEKTGIAWTDHTFNPWWGCTKVSPGCTNCYAERDAKRYGHKVWGVEAPRRFFTDKHWSEPLNWNRRAKADGIKRRVFCASMADLFEETGFVGRDFRLDLERERLYRLIVETPNLEWLLLTKRPEKIRKLGPPEGWPRNVRIGVSVESQEFQSRIVTLLESEAPHPWVSYEPALGPVNFRLAPIPGPPDSKWYEKVKVALPPNEGIEWVIIGGESGPGARPFDLTWARSVRDQCRAAGVACFVKQLGARCYEKGQSPSGMYFAEERLALHDRKGADPSEWPADLRVREFPR